MCECLKWEKVSFQYRYNYKVMCVLLYSEEYTEVEFAVIIMEVGCNVLSKLCR